MPFASGILQSTCSRCVRSSGMHWLMDSSWVSCPLPLFSSTFLLCLIFFYKPLQVQFGGCKCIKLLKIYLYEDLIPIKPIKLSPVWGTYQVLIAGRMIISEHKWLCKVVIASKLHLEPHLAHSRNLHIFIEWMNEI